MSKAQWLERVRKNPLGTFRRFQDVERDRRLKDNERVEILKVWPAVDTFERAQIAVAIERLSNEQTEAP